MANTILLLCFMMLLIKIAYLDYHSYTIKNLHLLCLLTLGLASIALNLPCDCVNLISKLLFVTLTFLPVYFLSDGLGGGDVKLLYCLVLPLSYHELLLAVFVALATAACAFACKYRRQKAPRKILPFAPCLACGFACALLSRCL